MEPLEMDAVKLNAVKLLGLSFDNLNLTDVVTKLTERDPASPFAYVVTPNADHFARLSRSPELVELYEGAFLCLLDSNVISNVARLFRMPAPPVATGAD